MIKAKDLIRAAALIAKTRHGKTKDAIRKELHIFLNLPLIRKSRFFDAAWYLKNNPDVKDSGMDPAEHYLRFGAAANRNPSPRFINEEYLSLHNDVRKSGINPLIHYERFGKREGRAISYLELTAPRFPGGCIETVRKFEKKPRLHGRTAVVASYFGDGTLSEALIYLLKGLREVVDNIVYVADSPVIPEEIDKLKDIVTIAKFERHGQYDFGSYRRGLEIARSEGLIAPELADELVIINDSSYGPVFPFSESFTAMAKHDCDFWGYTGYNAFGNNHISSYFYLFRRNVIDSGAIDEFLSRVTGNLERDQVIVKFELKMTAFLAQRGMKWKTYVPYGYLHSSPTKHPYSICRNFRMPLLKAKVVNGDSYESIPKTLAFVEKVNPELRRLIHPKPIRCEHKIISYEEHQASFAEKCKRIADKIREGKKAKAVFFVSSAAMFPARSLFEEMLDDAKFDPFVVVIPDLRQKNGKHVEAMEACRKKLAKIIPQERLSVAKQDEFDLWLDALEDADIVCYPSPSEFSSFRYNPQYAVGRAFLPICANCEDEGFAANADVNGDDSPEAASEAFAAKVMFNLPCSANVTLKHIKIALGLQGSEP